MADNHSHPYNRRWVLIIDDLPDDVLLEIFEFCVIGYQELVCLVFGGYEAHDTRRRLESWQSLVNVCRRWRALVFGSPRRLNLQLYYDPRAFTRENLDVWPALPLTILGVADVYEMSVGNAIAGFEHSDRIRQIELHCYTTSQIKKLQTAIQMPLPELAILSLSFRGLSDVRPVLPDSFLSGSAPRLRYFALDAIPFPGLPKLILSSTHLVNLHLHNIPQSGYISPEAMATCLSVLTGLENLQLEFLSDVSSPDLKSRRPFPPTHSVLPTLTIFCFKGVNEYLEEFVARIDAPQLYQLSTTYFDDINFKAPELSQFISRTPTLGAYDEAHLIFYGPQVQAQVQVRLRQSHPEPLDHRMVEVKSFSDRRLSSLAQICTLSLGPLLTIENLYIYGIRDSSLVWRYIGSTGWLDLLLPFTAVKNLYLSKLFSPRIALALQKLTGGRTTEVLPALQNVLLEGFQPSEPVQGGIAQFISARQLSNHPVAISVWDRDLWRDGS